METVTDKNLGEMTDTELDRVAAVEVMGWEYLPHHVGYSHDDPSHPAMWHTGERLNKHINQWCPTTNLNDAWRLVEKVPEKGGRSWADYDVMLNMLEDVLGCRDDDLMEHLFLEKKPARALTIAVIEASRAKQD